MSDNMTNDARLFEDLQRRFGSTWHSTASAHLDGLTMTEFKALMHMDTHGQAAMSEVAGALGLTLGACTNVVDNLVADGYVERQHDKSDRRVVRTSLTPKGEKEARRVAEAMASDAAGLLAGIGPEERTKFLEIYRKVVECAEKSVPSRKNRKAEQSIA